MRALAKDPALRHSSARAMADELRRVSRGGEVSADTQQATQVISAQQAAATSVLPPPYVPPETAGPKRSVWPWLLVVLFLVVAAAIGVIVYNQISGDQVTVPGGITGGTCAQAKARLATVGLKGDCVVAKNGTVKPGVIFAADPSPGSSVDSGSTVKLSQSGGPNTATMENLSGLSQADATSKLRDQGFTNITVLSVDSPAQTEGNVVSTKPVPGKTVPTSTAVELDVASGSVIVPTIGSNLDYNQASKKLQQQKLSPIKAEASDPTVPVGFVISISPVAGVRVEQGRQITVTISTGPGQGTVPAVKGFTASTATSALEQAGFKAAVIDYNSCTDQANDGLVTSQSPGGGTPATQGTKVYIRVDHYTPTDPSCTSPPTT
jgi:serine/threonine-protein kinase